MQGGRRVTQTTSSLGAAENKAEWNHGLEARLGAAEYPASLDAKRRRKRV